MGTVSLPNLDDIVQIKDPNKKIEALIETVGILIKNLSEINGYLTSKNVAEVGGWRVGPKQLASKDGEVGMSTDNDAPDPVRLWAGSADKDNAPWRVYKSGKSVMTGALIQSRDSGYPRIVMDPANDLFGAYSAANRYIRMVAYDGAYGSPALIFRDDTVPTYALMYIDNVVSDFNIISLRNMYIGAGLNELTLDGSRIKVSNWSLLYSQGASQTLQQALDAKVNQTNANAAYAVNMNFDPGTRNLKLFNANGSTIATVNIP